MAKYSPKVGAFVQYVIPADEISREQTFAAVITRVCLEDVDLTYFPIGGGTQGKAMVKHANDAKDGETFYRSVKYHETRR